jgi:hypothetical protein
LSSNPEIEQSWWHIEDQLKPSNCRTIRQVMDFYSKKEYIEYDLPPSDGEISGLQIINRENKGELGFIVENHKLFVNLGNFENLPGEMLISEDNLIISRFKTSLRKHVKLEIKYMEQYKKPGLGFDFNKWHFWDGYTGYFTIELPIRPEFMITVPFGMEIKDKGKKLELTLFRIYEPELRNNLENKKETHSKCPEKWYYKIFNATKEKFSKNKEEFFANFEEIPLKVEYPIVTKKDGKRIYSYTISQKAMDIILDTPETSVVLQTTYYVKNERKFWGVTLFAGILIFFTLVEIWRILIDPKNVGNPELSMLIALFSFTAFVLTLQKEDYEIPCVNFVTFSILFTISGMVFILGIYLFGGNIDGLLELLNI